MFDVEELLKKLNVDDKKKKEILNKKNLINNLKIIYSKYDSNNRLFYTLACTAPKKVDIYMISELINEDYIKNEATLRGVYKEFEKNKNVNIQDLKKFIKKNTFSNEEIFSIIKKTCELPLSKKEILIKLKNEIPFVDSKFVLDEVNKLKIKDSSKNHIKNKDWLDEGEISKLHKPGENLQINEKIMKEHLERTKGKVVTRFPPEPNGILHIGHAKAINLNFGYALKFGGYTYFRFDDTNPKNEEKVYFDSIVEDVKWLGFTPYKITASSDYFDQMIDFGRKLINKNKAYICELSVDEIRNRRRLFSEALEQNKNATIEELSLILSPFRNRSIEENLKIYNEMVEKKHRENTYTFRFKMNLEFKNPLMFDLVGMRIIDCDHVRTKDKYNLYPSYEFALCVSDSLEDVTHSFCTREFFTRQDSYNWLLDELEIYKPVQWEFSRLNISNTVVSKRKLVPLKKYGIELDDPRLYTIKGMRRRGIPATAINNFVKSLGITYAETIIDVKNFDSFIRHELNKTARRIMCVVDPLKIFIRNAKKSKIIASDNCENGIKREINFSPYIYIEKSDFMEVGCDDFLRFTKNQPVGLYLYGTIKFIKYENDMIIAEVVDEIPKKFIHWVECEGVKVELRLYDKLFESFNPDEGDYLKSLNLDSLKIINGICDKRILKCKIEEKFQLQRIGYFCVDFDSSNEKIILNKTISLK